MDDEIVKLRDLEHVTSIVVTHQIRDAYYVATREALREHGRLRIVTVPEATATKARFMVLHNGQIAFEGSGAEFARLARGLFAGVPVHDDAAVVSATVGQ